MGKFTKVSKGFEIIIDLSLRVEGKQLWGVIDCGALWLRVK